MWFYVDILFAFDYKTTAFLENVISVHSYLSINNLLILIVWRAINTVIEELGKKKMYMIGKLRAFKGQRHDCTFMLIKKINIYTF